MFSRELAVAADMWRRATVVVVRPAVTTGAGGGRGIGRGKGRGREGRVGVPRAVPSLFSRFSPIPVPDRYENASRGSSSFPADRQGDL